jgi:transcriptional regulator with XRE-family HTH domain
LGNVNHLLPVLGIILLEVKFMTVNIGAKIKELRLSNNLSQKDLAKELDVFFTAISKWELDQREPNLSTVVKLAKLFNVTTDYLLGLED